MIKLKIGTRGSPLALKQTKKVVDKLTEFGISCEIVEIKTSGDIKDNIAIKDMKETGVFVSEIERRLRLKEIDIAVHSLKDLTDIDSSDLTISAMIEREDPSDAFVSIDYQSIKHLPSGAIVGSSSIRRISQLRAIRKDLKVKDIRGNVETRLNKLFSKDYSALIMASAGLIRLGLKSNIKQILPIEDFTPIRGQGIIAVQSRKSDIELNKIIGKIDNTETRRCFEIEMSFSRIINGGCNLPIGICCLKNGNSYTLYAYIGDVFGDKYIKRKIEKEEITKEDAVNLAIEMKREGREIIEEIENKKNHSNHGL